MKILVDPCVSKLIADELSKKYNVILGSDVFPEGTDDNEVHNIARKQGAVLLTANYKDFETKYPISKHPGVISLRATNLTKYGYILEIVLKKFRYMKDYYEKRFLLDETKMKIKHKNGKISEYNYDDLNKTAIRPKRKRTRHRKSRRRKG